MGFSLFQFILSQNTTGLGCRLGDIGRNESKHIQIIFRIHILIAKSDFDYDSNFCNAKDVKFLRHVPLNLEIGYTESQKFQMFQIIIQKKLTVTPNLTAIPCIVSPLWTL